MYFNEPLVTDKFIKDAPFKGHLLAERDDDLHLSDNK